MSSKVAVLPGDGIGPEVVAQALRVLKEAGAHCEFEEALIGGCAYDATGDPLPDSTLELCKTVDAVLLGAVGGPQWDSVEPADKRPEVGALLPLRKELRLYANIRPAKTLPPLASASPVKSGAKCDLVVVRELTGGIYFGTPKHRDPDRAVDTCVYTRGEVERIAHRAFQVAQNRRGKVTSVDKANVLETSRLWREVVTQVAAEYPDVQLEHMLIDNCAMQLIRAPGQFDVILTENMFGDILSDEASMITGSLGMLPSASMSDGLFGLYEPVHGSAPDIAGKNVANPLAAILSGAMMLRLSLGQADTADRIERAVEVALGRGYRTPDIAGLNTSVVGTEQMAEAVIQALDSI